MERLSFNFIIGILLIIIILLIVNFFIILGYIATQISVGDDYLEYDIEEARHINPEEFTKEFINRIEYKGGGFSIDERGRSVLDRDDIWLQIVDKDGREVYNYKKNKDIPEKYSPFDMIDYYKYSKPDPIFINKVLLGGNEYNYILGFPLEKISKSIFIYNKELLNYKINNGLWIMLSLNLFMVSVLGVYFSRKIINPLKEVVSVIESLSKKEYGRKHKEKGIYRDVHRNLNQLSLELESIEEERRELDLMREEWISNISHDIKTPLSSIKGYGELLTSDYDISKDEINNYGAIIGDKSLYIEKLVNDLSLSARLKNKKLKLELEDVNLVSYLQMIIVDILNEDNVEVENIEFIFDSGDISFSLDRNLFERVIRNIIYNSIHHNNKGVKIFISLEKSRDKIEIIIWDNGKGIDPDDIKNIFNRYYRGTDTRSKGTGLGLAIANDIVEYHGGRISAKNVKTGGSEFKIYLMR